MTGSEFSERRARLLLTQAELARELGVHRTTVSAIETAAEVEAVYELALLGLAVRRALEIG